MGLLFVMVKQTLHYLSLNGNNPMQKLTKAQKEVVRKMRQGLEVRKQSFHPYNYRLPDLDNKVVNKNTMKTLIAIGIIIIVNDGVTIHSNPVKLTPLGKTIEL